MILLSLLAFPQSGYSQDTTNPSTNIKSTDTITKGLQIDTVVQQNVQPVIDTVKSVDSLMAEKTPENAMTNTKLFIYILLSVLGLTLFFFIFVITLFKTFHKKKSTRQSLLLSWNLFFIVTIIWLFIVWGLVAGFWTVASFMIVMIFLFIISLIMTIIALKSK
ncbi:MAG: hypothetical protein IPG99_09665 [Ignavibacteria bacterium]|nr:hypothetical protein [Ignavibacteria bacterium]